MSMFHICIYVFYLSFCLTLIAPTITVYIETPAMPINILPVGAGHCFRPVNIHVYQSRDRASIAAFLADAEIRPYC